MNDTRRLLAVAGLAAIMLASCTAGDPQFSAETPAGFWHGLWHGMISLIMLVVGIFNDSVSVYERNNTGGWYDLGFLMGVLCIWGSGSKASSARRHAKRRDEEWEAIAAKVDAKLKRRIRQWAESEPDDDWNVVEAKAEAKLKRKLRQWADED